MKELVDRLVSVIGQIIVGKEPVIRQALACLIARGHLLIEDLPGVGKTTLAHVIAQALGLQFQRIQFTSDLLPADIIGASVYERDNGRFTFHPGPVFSQVILADEVNRATPKTQSALLEAMEERQVTVEGETRALPNPFFVIATQNPAHLIGTFPLPESQLDRFLMRIEMGYPDSAAERELLLGRDRREMLSTLEPCTTPEQMLVLQQRAADLHTSHALIDYVQALVSKTRNDPLYLTGLSPRAGLALVRGAKAWAMMAGRQEVLPEDVQAVLPGVVSHRLHLREDEGQQSLTTVAQQLIESVPIP
ncbi:MAG: AAA family ATPase [Gammaproteobacteria bacterium]